MNRTWIALAMIGLLALSTVPLNAEAISRPRAVLAAANTSDVTTALDGTEASVPCTSTTEPCIHAGVPSVAIEIQCGRCPIAWEGRGTVHLLAENLDTGESCENFFPDFDCHLSSGGRVRFTLTAVSPGSESVLVFFRG